MTMSTQWRTQLAALVFSVSLFSCTTRTTAPTSGPPPHQKDDFEKKLKWAAMLDPLRNSSEQDRYKIEAYVRTFYSPRLDACLAEKYTLYSGNKAPETLEVLDLSSNKTVWLSQVECAVREVGPPGNTRSEYSCSDYAIDVERRLEDYVEKSHLENQMIE